ncbi:MAG: MerR family transcriptional regulator [Polyangiaceae bacterium]|nr:MerR family transcriptional regulator [Polyangiaceae bacterium]
MDDIGLASEEHGYSIRVTARLTGLSADTLRMWERRYGFPKPVRNPNGVRAYSADEVERLVLISRALKAGYRAGEVIHRSPDDLRHALLEAAHAPTNLATDQSPTLAGMIDALRDDDVTALQLLLRQAVATLGPRAFLMEVAAPLVTQVGERWAAGELQVRHEHLLTETLSTQLRLLLSAYESRGRPVVLLTTLPHESHGLGLEMAALYLALRGAEPRLLGVDAPLDQIADAARALGVDVVGLSVSASADGETVAASIAWLGSKLPPAIEIWVGGARAATLGLAQERTYRVAAWAEIDARLARFTAPLLA